MISGPIFRSVGNPLSLTLWIIFMLVAGQFCVPECCVRVDMYSLSEGSHVGLGSVFSY